MNAFPTKAASLVLGSLLSLGVEMAGAVPESEMEERGEELIKGRIVDFWQHASSDRVQANDLTSRVKQRASVCSGETAVQSGCTIYFSSSWSRRGSHYWSEELQIHPPKKDQDRVGGHLPYGNARRILINEVEEVPL